MSMVIANNMSAVNTKRQFGISARGQSGAMEKLSSGYKINTGKDDPSGLVVSEKLRSQLNGLKRARQNTEESINVMGIAEGALNEMNAILKKMKALAIHSNNTGVTSPDQIAADQAEMDSSIQTLDRIAQTTKFSTENLLNGSKDIAYDTTTAIKGTQQNSLLNVRDTTFSQIFKRDDYAVSINFTGTAAADKVTGMGQVDFSQQAMRAYLEVDTSLDATNSAQVKDGNFLQDQAFTLTGTKGSRAFTFKQGESVANMVSQIKSVADSTGIDAALVFNSDQKIDMTTTGVVKAAEAEAADQTFTIAGLNSQTKAGDPVTAVSFTLTKAMAPTLDKLDIDSLTFGVSAAADGTYTLTAAVNGDTKNAITVAEGWDGKAASLGGEIAGQIKYDPSNRELLTALGTSLSTTADITASVSKLEAGISFSNQTGNNGKKVLTDIFGAGDGDVTLDAKVDWNALYETLSDPDKLKFTAAAEAGKLKFTVVNDAALNQNNMEMTINVTDDAGNAYLSQRVAIAAGTREALLASNTATQEITSGILAGTKLTIDAKKFDFALPNTATGTTVTLQDGTPATTVITAPTNVSKQLDSKATEFDFTSAADDTPTDTISTTATAIVGIRDSADADVKFQITGAAGAYGNLINYLNKPGADQKFDIFVRLQSGQAEADLADTTAKYSIVANVGGEEVVLEKDWDGAAGTITLDITKFEENSGINADIVNAFTGLEIVTTQAVDWDTTLAAGGLYVDPATAASAVKIAANAVSSSGKAELSFAAVEVVGGMYDDTKTGFWAGAAGSVSIKMENVDLTAALTANSGMDEFIAAAAGGKIDVQAVVRNKVNADGVALDGEFEIEIRMMDNATGKAFIANAVIDSAALGLDNNGETNPNANGGWVTLNSGPLAGMQVKVENVAKTMFENAATNTNNLGGSNVGNTMTNTKLTATKDAAAPLTSRAVRVVAQGATALGQTGGIAADATAARAKGAVAVFNNVMEKDAAGVTDGTVEKGVAGVAITTAGAASVQLGRNTDGQGRIFVKFLDDNSFELYKDSNMAKESLVATGINGREISASNNSGLGGLTLNLVGDELTKVKGVYISLAGIEGTSTTDVLDAAGQKIGTQDGVAYNGDMVGGAGKALFDEKLTYITGVELGKNTDANGRLYLKTTYNHKDGTAQVSAYKDANMRAEDLVAQSDLFATRTSDGSAAASMTILLNEARNADNTAGTGLGIVLSAAGDLFSKQTKDTAFTGDVTFTNLGARLFAQDYGSANYVKITQDKGSIFNYYGSAGQNSSKMMVDAGTKGVTVQLNGQDASLSINGSAVKTSGLGLSMATQDIQANLVFNQGKVGSTTIAQVGYGDGSIFTKVGALNLGGVDAEPAGSKYENLSGLLANAGHVTNEVVEDFQGGMQLQLGEGAGDQNRTVVAIKSVTSENLGRVTRGGYWESGSSVYTEKTFTMKDVMGGGLASLKQNPTLAMAVIEQGISDVAELRAQIGAVQSNLLQTNSNNLAVTMENIQKTESGIRDADMADEMTEFTKNQVLQNAAMSMMSQANQSSQNVLQLLR